MSLKVMASFQSMITLKRAAWSARAGIVSRAGHGFSSGSPPPTFVSSWRKFVRARASSTTLLSFQLRKGKRKQRARHRAV